MQKENVAMKEREISIIDICIEMILHWRMIIIVMVIGGILFGGISYIQSVKTANAQKEELAAMEQKMAEQKELLQTEDEETDWLEADKRWLEEQLTETQLSNVNTVLRYEKIYEEKSAYQNEAILMQMDPFNVARAEITFLIQSDDLEKTYNIEKVYEDVITSVADLSYIQEKCGIEYKINELVLLEQTSYSMAQGTDTVRVVVLHSEEETCQDMANAIIQYVMQQQEELEKTLGTHEITVIAQSVGTVVSNDVLTQQRNCIADIITLESTITKIKAAFAEEEWRYYNFVTEGKATGNPEEEEVTETTESTITLPTVTVPRVSVKYIILGMVLFAFVYVFIIFMGYILNNKIRMTDNMQDLYSIPQLGAVTAVNPKKKFLSFIDEWILKLRYRSQRRFSAEEATNLAAVATKMAVKKQEINRVCLLGCNIADNTMKVCEQIKQRLSDEGISVQILSNVLYDAEVMEELGDAQGAVLVETVGSTLYDEIVKELELLNRQNITVLGGIVVE